jgi:uncharacterized protein (DUF1330 family)
MTAYLIVLRNEPVQDADAMEEYQRQTRLITPSVLLRPVVAYGSILPVEGTAPDAVVVVEFGSVADARAWYESSAYQEALPHRLRAGGYGFSHANRVREAADEREPDAHHDHQTADHREIGHRPAVRGDQAWRDSAGDGSDQ